jgi:predicted HNH restriction endonuclease
MFRAINDELEALVEGTLAVPETHLRNEVSHSWVSPVPITSDRNDTEDYHSSEQSTQADEETEVDEIIGEKTGIKDPIQDEASNRTSTQSSDNRAEEANEAREPSISSSHKSSITSATSPEVDSDIPEESSEELMKLRERAEEAATEDPERDINSTAQSRYKRAKPIKEYAKQRANGVCECCGDPAPFTDENGSPYLETHHVDELGEGGEDSPDKVVAICPNCHKQLHHGRNKKELNEYLRQKLDAGLADVGKE